MAVGLSPASCCSALPASTVQTQGFEAAHALHEPECSLLVRLSLYSYQTLCLTFLADNIRMTPAFYSQKTLIYTLGQKDQLLAKLRSQAGN